MAGARARPVALALAASLCTVAPALPAQTAPPSSSASPSSSSAPPAASSAAAEPGSSQAPSHTQPFGPGLAVQIESTKPWVYAYVAKGVVDDRPAFPDPFVKVGRLPVTIQLPPGTYTVIAEGDSVPTATRVFRVDQLPVHVQVHGGTQGLRDAGSLLTAVGVVALLAGAAFEVSGASDQGTSKKQQVAIPLLIAGGVGFAGGLTMFLLSGTSITDDGPTSEAREADHARATYRGVSLGGTF